MDSDFEDAEVAPDSYSIFQRDCNHHGGGVMILTHDHIAVTRQFDLETDCELLWLQITIQECEEFLFVCTIDLLLIQ